MRRWRWIVAMVLAGCVAWALPSSAAGQSAYDRIDVEKLAESLRRLRMYELLDQLAEEHKDSPAIRGITIEAKIARALATSGQARDALLDEAIAMLKQELADLKDATSLADEFKRNNLTLKLAITGGLTKGEPYADALLFLRGGQADRKALAAATKEPARLITLLATDLGDMRTRVFGKTEHLMRYGPQLRLLQNKTKYHGAMIHLYRGMSLDDPNERTEELRAAAAAVNEFITEDDDARPVTYWALLIVGRSEREMGDHDLAAGHFAMAASSRAPREVRRQAIFETARNIIEHARTLARQAKMLAEAGQNDEAENKATASEAKYAEAAKAIETFRAASARGQNEAGVRYTDLLAALLKSHLFDTRSEVQTDPAKSSQYAADSQGALMDFVSKYHDRTVQDAFYSLLYGKYRGRSDYENLNSVALMAIAVHEYSTGQGARGEKALERCEKALRTIDRRAESGDDPATKHVHPHALWRLAMIMNSRRDNLQAGKLFVQIARTYPKHPLAHKAGEFAVKTLFGVYQERHENKQKIAPQTRAAYIAALESYAGNPQWAKDDEVAKWNFQLAEEYDWMANSEIGKEAANWSLKAADAYEKVPRHLPEAMQARGRALRSRAKVLLSSPRDQSDKRVMGGRLVARLHAYSAEARSALGSARDKDMRADLLQWGSETDLAAAEILFDVLDSSGRAMILLKSLPSKWPGADVLNRSESLKIRKLVELGHIGQAVTAMDLFSKQHPKMSEGLLPLLIDKVQDKIRNLQGDELKKNELKRYQNNYFNLTNELFIRVKDQPIAQRYRITQTYADALLEVGKADEALKVLLICRAHDEATRKVRMKAIDGIFGPKITAVKAAAGDIKTLVEERGKYEALLTSNKIDPRRDDITGILANVNEAWNYYKRAENLGKAAKLKRQGEFAKSLARGVARIAIMLKKRVPLEAGNLLGLARAYHGVGAARKKSNQSGPADNAFRQAVEHYNRLLGGLDPRNRAHQRIFWQAQLGYCECVLEALGGNKRAMKNLLGRIRLLRTQSQNMGGYYAPFNRIEASAKRLSQ